MSSPSTDERKVRGDSELDALRDELQKEFFAYVEKNTLAKAQEFLATDPRYRIALSTTAIGNWAARKRKEAGEFRFSEYLSRLAENAAQSRAVVAQIAPSEEASGELTRANQVALNAALLAALQSGDPTQIKQAVKLSAMITEAAAKETAARAAVMSATTAANRFRFDAAKSALEHAEELQRINTSSGSEREKIERAIEKVFGRRPVQQQPEALAGGGNTADRASSGNGLQSGVVSDTDFITKPSNPAMANHSSPSKSGTESVANGGSR